MHPNALLEADTELVHRVLRFEHPADRVVAGHRVRAGRWLDVSDGMRVLDACAAPGGKTGHLLELADLDLTFFFDKDDDHAHYC